MKWKDKLSKEDLRHLGAMNITTLAAFKRTAAVQANMRKKSRHPTNEPCWECRSICEKLDVPL